MNKNNLAIIPARSGSKGLKDKNIKELNGKPLIAYAILEAQKTNIFDAIHVSTDSEKYAEIAKKWGADEPFLRSAEFAADDATTWDAVNMCCQNIRKEDSRLIRLRCCNQHPRFVRHMI